MDYGLWFPIYEDRIKPERKWYWLQIYAGIIIWGLPQCCRIIPVLRSWSVVWFYFTFIFIIEFILMVFDTKFVSDGL